MIQTKKYKQTEIGRIPEDWKVVKFTNHIKLKHGFQFLEHHFSNSGIPVVKIGNLINSGGIDKSKFTFVSQELYNKFKTIELNYGDVLMALTGATLGKVSRVNFKEKCLQNYRVGNFINDEKVLKGYIYFILQSFLVQKTVKELVNSGAQPNLGKADFEKIQIPLPPLPEQKAIAQVLSDTDHWIASLQKLIAKKQALKKASMQELLTPKEDWEVKRLGEVIWFQTGLPFKSQYFNSENIGLRLIKNRDLRSDDSIVYSNEDYPKEYLVENGDLLIGMDGDFEPVIWKKGKALLNQRVGRVKKKKEVSLMFLSYILINKLREIENSTGSTTVKHLSHSDVEKITLKLPIPQEQTRIATILSDMDKSIAVLEKKLDKARQIKQGLMQELLTGKTRLKFN